MRRAVTILCTLALLGIRPLNAIAAVPWQSVIPADTPATRRDVPADALIVGHVSRILTGRKADRSL